MWLPLLSVWKWFLLITFPLSVFPHFCLCRISFKEKYQLNCLCLFSTRQACLPVVFVIILNLTVSLLTFLLSSWLLIIQAIYKSIQAFCWCCTEVYLLFSVTSVKSLCRDADHHSPCLLAFPFLLHCPSCSKCSCSNCTCCLDQVALKFNVWWLTNCIMSLKLFLPSATTSFWSCSCSCLFPFPQLSFLAKSEYQFFYILHDVEENQ